MRKTIRERFFKKVIKTDSCWLWNGYICETDGGYGHAWDGTRNVQAHWLSYFLEYGRYPTLTLDHLCRVRHCVNPAHLEEVTIRENTQRARKAQCKYGHPLSGDNLRIVDAAGHRQCITCQRRRGRESYYRRRQRMVTSQWPLGSSTHLTIIVSDAGKPATSA